MSTLGYVGTLTLRLEMPWVRSLKEKRSLVKPVVEKLKVRFPVTAARLDGLDAHDWEVIAVVTVSNDYSWVEETLRLAADFVATGDYQITEEWTDITALE
ncbi:hypothetical protein GCM10017783_07190 [Deinococcus piscis]|uniref:DUF503 domain-containing protein n=1 Tax=Deinococcus piscis TaxID=394230 RepID=A0ABQ3K3R3_9DEIO|nr:DUF503 domain-containing protein [Deinococcus piscis]GHF97882.1 hypothetical protein GCM10017783_07190 [Deinococcus piscis]